MQMQDERSLGILLLNKSVTDFPYDLDKIATQDFGDLTAVYMIEDEKKVSFITKEFCRINKIQIGNLHEEALKSQRARHPYTIESMNDVLNIPDSAFEELPFPIYIVKNDRMMFGASVILQPEVLMDIAETLRDDFYIIPSSLHEVLVVPALREPGQEEALNEMVHYVNSAEVSPEERLSDSVVLGSKFMDIVCQMNLEMRKKPEL